MSAVQTISILGCGWLGLPLASRFLSLGLSVKGATSSSEKLSQLERKGIKPYLIKYDPHQALESSDFFQTDVLIVTIPFRRDLINPQFYQEQIQNVIKDVLAQAKMKPWIIFTSSSLVYEGLLGEVSEEQILNPLQERAKILYAIEQELLTNKALDVTIIRLAGLYGPNREIHRFMERASVKNGSQRVNLIHLEDCIGIIEAIIRKQIKGEIFNAVSDEHPGRAELYSKLAVKEGLPIPHFEKNEDCPSKIVSNRKLKAVLEYRFQYPDPLL